MPIYVPKKIVSLAATPDSPLFFLAGPIRGGGDWQADMADHILGQEPSAQIACPCRWGDDHWLAPHFHLPFSQADNRQLVWERHYLKQTGIQPKVPGCVIFWLGLESETEPHPGPQPYAMDTRRELGKFIAYLELLGSFPELKNRMDVRVAIGGDRRFHGLDVILFELGKAIGKPFPFYETMAEVVFHAIMTARR